MPACRLNRVNVAGLNSTEQFERLAVGKANGFVNRQHFGFRPAKFAESANAVFTAGSNDENLAAFRGDQNFL